MQLHRISFSSHEAVEDPFKWAYTLEDHGYTGWEIVQEGSPVPERQEYPEFEKYR